MLMRSSYDRYEQGNQLMRYAKICTLTLLLASATILFSAPPIQAAPNHFTPFEWASVEMNGQTVPKVAMLVPITIAGCTKTLYAQFDTGSDATIFYGKFLRKHGLKLDSAQTRSLDFSWSDGWQVKSDSMVVIDWSMDDSINVTSTKPIDNIVGTIGASLILGKILVIDFPRTRFAVFEDTLSLSTQLACTPQYVSGHIRHFRLYVPVVIGSDTLFDVLFDTGSSSSTLTLPDSLWRKATGLTDHAAQVKKDTIMAWGKSLNRISAIARADLKFGTLTVKAPVIDHVEWTDPSLTDFRIMGNAPFYDSCVVVVDTKYARLGVARSADCK
jgi:hypothetical protein